MQRHGTRWTFCETNNVPEPLRTWSPCAAVNDVIYYDHPAIPEWQGSVLMAVLGGFQDPVGGRLNVLHMSDDGLTLESDEYFFDEFNQRIRDVAVNPYTGAMYLALNGPSYTGNGPNLIKEFRPTATDAVNDWDTTAAGHLPQPGLPSGAVGSLSASWTDSPTGHQHAGSGAGPRVNFKGQHVLDVSTWPAGRTSWKPPTAKASA